MRRIRCLPVVLGLLVSRVAHADVGDWESDYDPGHAVRRSAFAAGVTMGALVGGVSGYPNEAEKIGVARYEAGTGPAGGTGGGFWLGVAPRDWLVLGLGASFGSVAGSSSLSNGGAFVLHLEAFPLFERGGLLRDLGVIGEFGAGSRNVFHGSTLVADGGLISCAGFGVVYEPVRVGSHVSAGPVLLVSHQFSQTIAATLVTAGVQVAFYGGPG
jgi:hypothetical protein